MAKRNFKIDGFDVSREAIVEAQKGEITYDNSYRDIKTGDFLEEMEAASLIKRGESPVEPRKRWFRRERQPIPMPPSTNYSLDESVRSRMDFFTHDIIEEHFGKQEQYNVVVCNTVLQHYPPWTRELILAHILESLGDGGILALEINESLDPLGGKEEIMTKRSAWLKPYYDWKKDLSKFGLCCLAPEEVESEKELVSTTFYHYETNKNQYRGKKLAIRDRKLVEIPGE